MGLPTVIRVVNLGLGDWLPFSIDNRAHDVPRRWKQEILKRLRRRGRHHKNDAQGDLPHKAMLSQTSGSEPVIARIRPNEIQHIWGARALNG